MVHTLQGFLGLIGYYRQLIHGYANLAALLTELLWKNAFLQTTEASKAFQTLKDALVTIRVLHVPNFDRSFKI